MPGPFPVLADPARMMWSELPGSPFWMTMSPGLYSAKVARRTSLRNRRLPIQEKRGKLASTSAQSDWLT